MRKRVRHVPNSLNRAHVSARTVVTPVDLCVVDMDAPEDYEHRSPALTVVLARRELVTSSLICAGQMRIWTRNTIAEASLLARSSLRQQFARWTRCYFDLLGVIGGPPVPSMPVVLSHRP